MKRITLLGARAAHESEESMSDLEAKVNEEFKCIDNQASYTGDQCLDGHVLECPAIYRPAVLELVRAERKRALDKTEYLTDPLALAVLFHVTYEKLAPQKGYETRKETRIFDPESANGKLMIATCSSIQGTIRALAVESASEPGKVVPDGE